jgi:ApaG protein
LSSKLEITVTNGIKVSVETFYQEEYSRPQERKFIFAYRITIENMSPYAVQLMHRHWYIADCTGLVREVEGEGVIGKQPILEPGEAHQYVSWSHLFTEIGKMSGYYTFQRLSNGEPFKADIPAFSLVTPYKMN